MLPTTYFAILTNRLGIAVKLLGSLSERRVVSKPQNVSRLRYVNIIQRRDETPEEKYYRSRYDALQDWNNKYWAENNQLFNREKDAFIESRFGTEASKEEALSHDQLASFYQTFLERNRDKHVDYNRIWYRNHAALLASSVNAKLSRLKVNLTKRKSKREE